MSKRARTAAGNTRRDYHPNFMSWSVVESGADTFTSTQVFTPIPRGQGGAKVTVMELLWAEWDLDNVTLNNSNESVVLGITTGVAPTALTSVSNPATVCYKEIVFNMLTSGAAVTEFPLRYEFQSKDGAGVLLASDSFHSWVDSFTTGAAITANVRLYYRFVSVSLTEYIGIMQSAQQS